MIHAIKYFSNICFQFSTQENKIVKIFKDFKTPTIDTGQIKDEKYKACTYISFKINFNSKPQALQIK